MDAEQSDSLCTYMCQVFGHNKPFKHFLEITEEEYVCTTALKTTEEENLLST